MTEKQTIGTLASLVIAAALVAGCAPADSADSIIGTSVAQTVAAQDTAQAQFTPTATMVKATLTPLMSPHP